MTRHLLYGAALAALHLPVSPQTAFAGVFDPQTGQIQFEAALGTFGFEEAEAPAALPLTIYDPNFAIQSLDPLRTQSSAIEGTHALEIGGTTSTLMIFDLNGLAASKRVEVRLWQRAEGTTANAFLIWFSGDVSSAIQSASFGSVLDVGVLPLMPTGRTTTDGWSELSSGPFDLLLAGKIAPVLFVEDVQRRNQPPFSANFNGRVLIDAVEVLDLGPPITTGQACRLANEETVCGPQGRCSMGRCADSAVVDGPIFSSAELRNDYLDRRLFELRAFGGHRLLRQNLDAFEEALSTLRGPDQSPRFWTTMSDAYDNLGDGHIAAPAVNPVTPIPSGVCVHQSQADLLPSSIPEPAELPMIFRVTPTHPVAAGLAPGDVLIEVDGLPVNAWRELAAPLLRYTGTPAGREVIETPQLMSVAIRTGATLRFARCDHTDGVPCLTDELTLLTIDTSSITAPIWDGVPSPWLATSLPCEPRFLRVAEDADIGSTFHVASADQGDVRLLAINGTPGPLGMQGPAWLQETTQAFMPAPTKMLLDERRGDGGTFVGVQWLTRFFFATPNYPADIVFPWLGAQEQDLALRRAMVDCSLNAGPPFFGYFICGGAYYAGPNLLMNFPHPSPGIAEQTKLAIVTGQDASGNDWLTYHLRRFRADGTTRVFGPTQLFGAYGEVITTPLHRIGFGGPNLQWTGGVIVNSDQDPLETHVGGAGIVPDEQLLQLQSDAMRGVDTIMEAALSWLAED